MVAHVFILLKKINRANGSACMLLTMQARIQSTQLDYRALQHYIMVCLTFKSLQRKKTRIPQHTNQARKALLSIHPVLINLPGSSKQDR